MAKKRKKPETSYKRYVGRGMRFFKGEDLVPRLDVSARRQALHRKRIPGYRGPTGTLGAKCVVEMIAELAKHDAPGHFERVSKVMGTPFERTVKKRTHRLLF